MFLKIYLVLDDPFFRMFFYTDGLIQAQPPINPDTIFYFELIGYKLIDQDFKYIAKR